MLPSPLAITKRTENEKCDDGDFERELRNDSASGLVFVEDGK